MGKGMTMMALGSEYDAARAAGLKARLTKIKGVAFVDFNYTTEKLTVKFDPDLVNLRELKKVVTMERKRHARLVRGAGSRV